MKKINQILVSRANESEIIPEAGSGQLPAAFHGGEAPLDIDGQLDILEIDHGIIELAMYITGVILAAGMSSRMGPINKLFLRYKNHTIIEEVFIQLANSKVDEILIVTGFERERIENALPHRLKENVRFIHNREYHRGRAESIKCAVKDLKENVDAILFMVADKPGISSALVNRAIKAFERERPMILYVETPTGRGHPIMFSRRLFNELLALNGDRVGEELVTRYEGQTLKLKDEAPQIDVDNEDDYRMLTAGNKGNK